MKKILIVTADYYKDISLGLLNSAKKNENVTGSILIWAIIILIPLVTLIEQPWNTSPRLDSIISVVYLGLFSTGIAWLLRFKILVKNGCSGWRIYWFRDGIGMVKTWFRSSCS